MLHNIEAKTIKMTTILSADENLKLVVSLMNQSFDQVVKNGNYNNFMQMVKPLDLVDGELKMDLKTGNE